jgi:hypothetical protein
MGIKMGTTITVEFTAEQVAQLDCLLQQVDIQNFKQETDYQKKNVEWVNNVFSALHKAGYR